MATPALPVQDAIATRGRYDLGINDGPRGRIIPGPAFARLPRWVITVVQLNPGLHIGTETRNEKETKRCNAVTVSHS